MNINLSDVINNKRINEKYHLIDSKNGRIQIELQWRASSWSFGDQRSNLKGKRPIFLVFLGQKKCLFFYSHWDWYMLWKLTLYINIRSLIEVCFSLPFVLTMFSNWFNVGLAEVTRCRIWIPYNSLHKEEGTRKNCTELWRGTPCSGKEPCPVTAGWSNNGDPQLQGISVPRCPFYFGFWYE